jgi:hypothetical protein
MRLKVNEREKTYYVNSKHKKPEIGNSFLDRTQKALTMKQILIN